MATLKYYNPNLDAWTSSSGNVLLGSDIPIGVVLQFSGKDTMIPDGFLICDGSSLLRTDYPDLFNVIGTTYGSTDNTHFNLPNIKGKTIVSLDSNDNDFNKLGKTVREKTHSLTKNELPSMDVYMTKDTWFDRGGLEAGGAANRRVVAGGATGGDTSYIIDTVNGGNQPHNNIQPSFVQYTIIKAKKTSYTASKVIDNLNSDSNTNALSANQGKVLNEKINKLVKTYTLASDANSFTIDGLDIQRDGGIYDIDIQFQQSIANATADAANEWLAMQKEANIPVVVEYKLAKEIIEPHKNALPLWIDQYKNQTNIYTSDESEVEVETTSNESLANIQKEIKSLYDKSKAYNSDYINNTYSTDEMKTGETWIDGKPIYRKTFVFTGITATSASLSFSSSNASETIMVDNSHSYVSTSANFSLPINMYNSSTDYIRTYVNSGDKKLFVEFGSVYTMSKNIYVTLRYTKTTD